MKHHGLLNAGMGRCCLAVFYVAAGKHLHSIWRGPKAVNRCKVAAIVAGVNLADPDAEAQLDELKAKCPRLRGNRYIIDYVGPFEGGKNATHPNMLRHDGGVDFLRDPAVAPAFEKGFAALAAEMQRVTLKEFGQ